MDNAKNVQRFEELMGKVDRDGKDALMEYIHKSDFYTAPASTRFHLSTEGGLLQHSLNVYDCLSMKQSNPFWAPLLEKAGEESLIVSALLHDLCKTYFYVPGTKNQKTYDKEKVAAAQNWQVKHDAMGDFIWETVRCYEVDDRMPLGHGEKSVMLIQEYMRLKPDEMYAIRWHMGYTVPKEEWNSVRQAFETHPLALALHEADLEASAVLEDTSGNK